MDFTADQLKWLREWNERLSKPLSIRLLLSEDERTGQFQRFAETLTRHASKVRFATEKGEGVPALIPGDAWQYHLVPAGAEFKPFLELITMIAQGVGKLPGLDVPVIQAVQWPTRIKIFVTNYCPHCREVVTRIMPLPLFNPLIHITIIDGAMFPELAATDKVRSVPTVICDGRFRWTGLVRLNELIDVLKERDPSQLGVEIFKRMIQEGETGRLADMMLGTKKVFQGFLDALMDSEFQTRLGAMVVFEDIAERDPALARTALAPIWERIDAVDESVRGDMIYLVGKAGGPEWISRLENHLFLNASRELRAIIDEALEDLKLDNNK